MHMLILNLTYYHVHPILNFDTCLFQGTVSVV